MAITETGYSRPTYEDILDDLTLKAQELFGEDIDVSDQTPLGKIVNMIAYVRAKDNENAELIYFSRFPNTAIGTNLDRLCPFFGLKRDVATHARYIVKVIGEEKTVIPLGFLVSTESGIQFYNTAKTEIPAGTTTCNITVECINAGDIGNVAPNSIIEIDNPEAGIDSIVGVSVISAGRNEESDYELRQRMLAAGEGAGSCNEASIRASLLRVPTVTNASVVVNDTDTVDSMGLVPHSIACYVAGGKEYATLIGEAIFDKKPVGIKTNGNLSVNILDDGGFSHTIKYNEMQMITVSVEISIKTTADFSGANGITEIKNNISNFINGLSFGNDVILSELYGYIYSVNGVQKVTSLKLSTDGINFNTNDIAISTLECSVCKAVKVTEV